MNPVTITATLTTKDVTLKDATMKDVVKWFDKQHEQFALAAMKVHRKTVFEILIYLLRVCPVLTGRLRGSWTPYLDRYGKQASYSRFLSDKSLVRSAPKTALGTFKAKIKEVLSLDAVSKGKAEGSFTESGMLTTVSSNVVYAAKVNESSHYFDRTSETANSIINANFENFLAAARKEGWIPPADFSDEPRPEF